MSHSTVASLRQADSTTTQKIKAAQLTMNVVHDNADMEAMYTDLFSDSPFPFFGASHASILAALESRDEGGLVLSPKDDLVSSTTSVASSDEPWASPASAIMSPKCYQDLDAVKPTTDLPSSPKTYKDLDAPSTPLPTTPVPAATTTNLQPVSQEFSLVGLQEAASADTQYTLTLTDGTIVQLQVTKEDEDINAAAAQSDGSWLQPQQQPQDFDTMFQALLQAEGDSHSSCSSTPSSPTAVRTTRKRAAAPTTAQPQPIRKNPKRSATTRSCDSLSSAASTASSGAGSFEDSGAGSFEDDEGSYDELLNMFTSCQHVTIESLKAKLSAGPDGCADLGALLVAAKVDLALNDIVGPPLNTVKKTMIVKGLSDWQQTLCLKIRRRKKNTAAVRSSRRKRNQYVQNLREHVTDLKKRKHDGLVQNKLLKQLVLLWQRLIAEVEEEIKAAGVTVSGPTQKPDSTLPSIPPPLIPIEATPPSKPAKKKQASETNSKRVSKRQTTSSKQDSPPLVFVVLPPQNQQLNDEIDREARSPTTLKAEGGEGQKEEEYELQLEDEVVPVILTNASREDEDAYNNGRNFIKIAPRQQQRIFLLKTPDAKVAKGV